jgi:hypothetical protein
MMRRGERPRPDELVGWELRGANTHRGAPLVRLRKFVKGFHRDRRSGGVMGFNVPVVQNRLEEPWLARPSEAAPRRFAFFAVVPVDATERDNAFLNAVLLDYGRGGNFALDPAARLRDYLVRVDDDLYVGKAYVALGPARIPLSHFVLERHRPHDYVR